jgi:protein tyrosine phosphatase (PTP) superfamily phosphohydrolase (DUF442 family)
MLSKSTKVKNEGLGSINYQELYKSMKIVHTLDSKRIKKMLLYNYINDSIESIIFDCRNKNNLKNFPNIPNNSRLILILNDNEDIKTSKDLEQVRDRIRNNDQISGLFHIFNIDYNDTMKTYPFLFMKNRIDLPLCAINDILYIGGFINSKNKQTMQLLRIKTIISLMKEPDKELTQAFGDNYRNFKHEEVNHDEIEYGDLSDYAIKQINNKQTPVLIYCFSGKTSSLAAAVPIIMKFKKWPLELSLGYVMKLSPTIEIAPWLYTQLMRYRETEEINKKKEMSKKTFFK